MNAELTGSPRRSASVRYANAPSAATPSQRRTETAFFMAFKEGEGKQRGQVKKRAPHSPDKKNSAAMPAMVPYSASLRCFTTQPTGPHPCVLVVCNSSSESHDRAIGSAPVYCAQKFPMISARDFPMLLDFVSVFSLTEKQEIARLKIRARLRNALFFRTKSGGQ